MMPRESQGPSGPPVKSSVAARRKKLRAEGLCKISRQFIWQRSLDGIRGCIDSMREEDIGLEWLLRAPDGAGSPFSNACRAGFADAVILMLDRGVSQIPDWFEIGDCSGPLGLAVGEEAQSADGLRLVHELISRGVDIERPDHRGARPLGLAAQAGSSAAIEALLAAGAEVAAVDDDGCSALFRSLRACGKRSECMLLLLEAGADPHAKNAHCPSAIESMELDSPYASAAEKNRLSILRSWIERRSIQKHAALGSIRRGPSRI